MICASLASVLILATLQAPPPPSVASETDLDRQVRELSAELRCPVCQGLSLADSPAELSQDMRALIREQLEAGRTPAEVKEYFVGRYGEWILMSPRAEGFNLAVYVLPVVLLVGGAILVMIALRRWTRAPAPVAAASAEEMDPDLAAWEDLAS